MKVTVLSVALVITNMQLNTAAQAARLVWFTESRLRVALSCTATVNMSTNRQSFVGFVAALPDHLLHLYYGASSGGTGTWR